MTPTEQRNKKLCMYGCGRKAVLPDRYSPGRRTKRVCRECHAKLLAHDMADIMKHKAEERNRDD